MGTKVQSENYFTGHCSMRDLSRESNGANWSSYYGDNNLANGQYYYGFLPRTVTDSQPGYDKDVMKQTMLEHEATFKNQVYELHRLYQVQRDLMDEVRRKEQFKNRIPYETSSSSSPVPSHMQSEDLQRWNGASHPLANPAFGRSHLSGPETVQSSPHSVKGKSIQAGPSPFQSCASPKNSEVSESRPTKCRRRMLDLQLPADEYIDPDEVEQLNVSKVSDNISPSPDKNLKFASENGKSDFRIGKSMALADLNEPLHVEESNDVSSVDFLRYAGSHGDAQNRDLQTKFFSPKDVPENLRRESLNGPWDHSPFESKPNGRDWLCHALESEQHRSAMTSINQASYSEKVLVPPQPVQQVLHVQPCQPPTFLTGDHVRGELWKTKSGGTVNTSDRSYSLSNYNLPPESMMASHIQSQPGLFHPADLGKSWDQSASSWLKPSSGVTQMLTSLQASPLVPSATSSKSPQSSAQSNGLFGNKWNLNANPTPNAVYGSDISRNGFYPSTFREVPAQFPPAGLDYGNYYGEKMALSNNVHYSLKDMNLNAALPNGVLKNPLSQQGVRVVEKDIKSEDPLAALPWLRGKVANNNEVEHANNGANKGPKSLESALIQGHSLTSRSCDGSAPLPPKTDIEDCPGSRKILGVPIFVNPPTPKKERWDIQSEKEEVGTSGRKVVFDINLPCELSDSEDIVEVKASEFVQKKMETGPALVRNHFDLNSCIIEEEIPFETEFTGNSERVKSGTGIDLEAPVVLESEDDILLDSNSSAQEPKKQPEMPVCRLGENEAQLAKSAADAIVAISSFCILNHSEEGAISNSGEGSMEDPLHWFVDIACSNGNELDNQMIIEKRDVGQNGDIVADGLDEFESLVLRQKECTFEEYFPKPSFPEVPNIEENGTCLLTTTRTRKGQARRGRQRRDFQRDILPGLTSLSRHEVTEDLQTFGGLMRATGYPWHSGPNRRNATRNGSGRGRRRGSVATAPGPTIPASAPLKQQQQQPQINGTITEVGVEDRSLTGWGKTTRRPRRQRCPAGNLPPPVPLS